MKKTIFSSPSHEAFVVHRAAETVVVSFAERKEPVPANFSGEAMLAKTEHAYCCIRSLVNDWYVGPGYDACLEAVREELQTYQRVILYGFSMGSYGALISAKALNADRVVVMAPIANIHPQKDRRWIADYEEHIKEKAAADLSPKIPDNTEIICVYDPKGPDRGHVADLRALYPVQEIMTPRAGHMVFRFLNNGGILGSTTRALFETRVDIGQIQSQVIASKKNNSYYIGELARALTRHKFLKKILLRYAVRKFPKDLTIRLDYAGTLAEAGNTAQAAELIRTVVTENKNIALSVPVIRALVQYAENGGNREAVADLIVPYAAETPRAREAQLLYSRFLRHTKSFDDAFRAHEAFMKGGPFSAQGFFERGLIFEEVNLPYMAETSYRQALAEDQSFLRAAQRLRLLEDRRKG